MPDEKIERVELQVPLNTGFLIGNTLRQFAMRGSNTWQPAAYKISGKDGTFGLSGGYSFSVLVFSQGRMLFCNDDTGETEKQCQFVKDGENYVCDNMVITGLGSLQVPAMSVCLVYAGGSRTKEQNYAVAKRLCGAEVNDYVTVPSRHTPTVKFRYEVRPRDNKNEVLCIEATPGVLAPACNSAVALLTGLHI